METWETAAPQTASRRGGHVLEAGEDGTASLDPHTPVTGLRSGSPGLTTALAAVGGWCWEDENTPGWSNKGCVLPQSRSEMGHTSPC